MTTITRFFVMLALVFIAPLAAADAELGEHNGRFCGGAANATWEQMLRYANEEALVGIETAYAKARCRLSEGNSDEYVGNLLHTSIRMNPNARSVISSLFKYLLRDEVNEENRAIFVSLILGSHVDYNTFQAIKSSYRLMPGRRGISMFAARAICTSIDRHNFIELADIRRSECNTPPFVEPWRLP